MRQVSKEILEEVHLDVAKALGFTLTSAGGTDGVPTTSDLPVGALCH